MDTMYHVYWYRSDYDMEWNLKYMVNEKALETQNAQSLDEKG